MSLLESENYNTLMLVIDKFSKAIRLVFERKIWITKQWAKVFDVSMLCSWELFYAIISNRNFKFIERFWTHLLKKWRIKWWMTTVYHSQRNEQSEKTNQTVEIILCCLLMRKYEFIWSKILSQIKWNINMTSTMTMSINSFEILHEMKWRLMSYLNIKVELSFLTSRQDIWDRVRDVMNMTQTCMIINFNNDHKLSNFKHLILICLIRVETKKYFISKSFKLALIKTDSFSIIRKVENLTYEVKFLKTWKVHLIISITHLKQAYEKKRKSFRFSKSSSVIVDKQKEWEVERILNKIKDAVDVHYCVKWREFEKKIEKLEHKLRQNMSEMIAKFEELSKKKRD